MYLYIYIYMAIDLKVFVKSLNCEDRSCSVGNPRDFFSSSQKSFCARKLNILNHYCIHIQIHTYIAHIHMYVTYLYIYLSI